jgi:hypothetical protein
MSVLLFSRHGSLMGNQPISSMPIFLRGASNTPEEGQSLRSALLEIVLGKSSAGVEGQSEYSKEIIFTSQVAWIDFGCLAVVG